MYNSKTMETTIDFTQREIFILRAVLSYALSNTDELNEAFEPTGDEIDHFEDHPQVSLGGDVEDAFTEEELFELSEKCYHN